MSILGAWLGLECDSAGRYNIVLKIETDILP